MGSADNLWSIGGALYDLTEWADRHPGGSHLIHACRGSDCTALFETHHPLVDRSKLRGIMRPLWRPGRARVPEHDWSHTPIYDDMKRTVRTYGTKYGTKAWDMPGWRAWYVTLALVFPMALWWWMSDAACESRSIGASLSVGVVLWLGAADAVHSGMHGSLGPVRFSLAAAWTVGALFCLPSVWLRQHVIGHHPCTNQAGKDPDLNHHPHSLLPWRVSPSTPWRGKFARWRLHLGLTVWMTQLVPSIGYGVSLLWNNRYPYGPPIRWAPGERVRHAASLGTVVSLISIQAARGGVVYGIAPFAVCGTLYYLFSQVSHINAVSMQPTTGEWAVAQLASSAGDYSTTSTTVTLLSIGLNSQALHHLFPTVHHAHHRNLLAELVPVLAKHSQKVPGHAQTFAQSLRNHFHHLRTLNDREHVAFRRVSAPREYHDDSSDDEGELPPPALQPKSPCGEQSGDEDEIQLPGRRRQCADRK